MIYISHPKDKGTSPVLGCKAGPVSCLLRGKPNLWQALGTLWPPGFLGTSGWAGTCKRTVTGRGRSRHVVLHSILAPRVSCSLPRPALSWGSCWGDSAEHMGAAAGIYSAPWQGSASLVLCVEQSNLPARSGTAAALRHGFRFLGQFRRVFSLRHFGVVLLPRFVTRSCPFPAWRATRFATTTGS